MNFTNLKENIPKQISQFKLRPRPEPKPLSYSSHAIISATKSYKDSTSYATPQISYNTFKKDYSYRLQINCPKNTVQIDGFSTKINDIILFKPKKDIFKEIEYCILVVLENQLIIYGIEITDMKFALVSTNMSVMIGDDIKRVSISEDGIIMFCSESDVYRFCYGHGVFYRTYAKCIKSVSGTIMELVFGSNNDIVDVCVTNSYMVILKEKSLECYRIINNKFKHIINYEIHNGIKVQIYDDRYFFVFDKEGNRIFFDQSRKIETLPLCQETVYYDGEVLAESDGNTSVIIKKRFQDRNCLVIVITQNEYALEKGNNCRENYNTFFINDDINKIKIWNRNIGLFSNEKSHFINILTTQEYILQCKQIEVQKLMNFYGEGNFLIQYLFLIENEEEVGKIEFLFLKTTNFDFIYKYIFQRLIEEEIIESKNCKVSYYYDNFLFTEDFFNDYYFTNKARIQRCLKKFVTVYNRLCKYRKKGLSEIIIDFKNVIDSLKFLKIVEEKRINVKYNFEDLLTNMDYRRKVLTQLSNIMSFERTSEMIQNTLRGYFPIEEVYYRRGLECLKKKRKDTFYDSITDFKKGKNYEETVNLYFSEKFYVGSVTIIRDCLFDTNRDRNCKKFKNNIVKKINLSNVSEINKFLYFVKLIKKNLVCRGSLNEALNDNRKEYIFIVLEAYLQKLLSGTPFTKDCTCCQEKKNEDKFYNEPIDIIYLKNDFLREFLESKYLLSNDQREYNLLWKYYIYIDESSLAAENLIDIAKNKLLSFEKRKEYLHKSLCVENNDDTKLLKEVALIQEELFNNDEELFYLKTKLLDVNELFNYYLYPNQEYLSLKLLKLVENEDEDIKKELFEKMLSGNYIETVERLGFIKDLNADHWVRIETIGDILINKLSRNNEINMVNVLTNYNYSEKTVRIYLEERLKGTEFMHPEMKRRILNEIKEYYGEDNRVKENEKYCLENYGIRL
ncbi:hypothetical protein COBT_001309 [Conglomerata obtusa]